MTNVYLGGRLGKIVGKRFKFHTRNLKEVFDAIEANTNKLRSFLLKDKKRVLAIFVNDREIDSSTGLMTNVQGKTVKVLPMLKGGFVKTAAAIVAVLKITGTAAKVATFIITAVLYAALSFGISLLMAKLMAEDDPESENTTSFIFGQAENVTSQGGPVPVGYGRMIIGSRVVSVKSLDFNNSEAKSAFEEFVDSVAPIGTENEKNISDYGVFITK